MRLRNSRQTVTGLTVNQKVNIQADYYRRVRSMSYQLFKTGLYFQQGSAPVSALPVLEGQLNHCFRVKHEVAHSRKVYIQNDKREKGVRKLYRRFLFYKHFVQLTKPLLICEGKTDVIYIKTGHAKFSYELSFARHDNSFWPSAQRRLFQSHAYCRQRSKVGWRLGRHAASSQRLRKRLEILSQQGAAASRYTRDRQ